MNECEITQMALSCGATKSQAISVDTIAASSDFRGMCEANQCGLYGKCYMCPPDVGDIDKLMEELRTYEHAVIYQTIAQIEDSFDIEGMTAASHEHVQTSLRIQSAVRTILPPGFLHLTCGGCRVCETCAKQDGEACRHPDEALPSLESYGVDVYNTVKNTNLKYINGQNTVTYFGMLLWGD